MSRRSSRRGRASIIVDPEVTVNVADHEDVPVSANLSDHDEPEINPEDSASQLRSGTSSVTSSRAKLVAKAAALRVEAEVLKQRHRLEAEEAALRRKREEFELHAQLAVLTAEANALGETHQEQPQQQQVGIMSNSQQPFSNLNPMAPQWTAAEYTGFNRQLDDMVLGRHQELLAAVHLPHAEIMHFDGNPLDYWSFIRSFQNTIERVCTDDVSKLTRLLQYCKGRAKHVIQCCAVMDPKEGFERAKSLLKERFGNNYVIAEAWVNKVAKGKAVSPHDKEALREFADDLVNCEVTLTAMNCLQEVNSQRVLVEIVGRLPTYLQNRWIRQVREVRTNHGREANMKDLVSFVTAAAEEATDPVYSKLTSGKEKPHGEKNYPQQKFIKRQSFSGLTNHDSTPSPIKGMAECQSRTPHVCIVCGGPHNIFQCERFRGLKPEERRKLVQSKGLCFNCLKGGHRAEACELQRICSVPGCGRKHTRYLHLTPVTEATVSSPSDERPAHTVSANQGTGQAFSGAGIARVALPLVPVKAWAPDKNRYISTYALLDNGSTTSFCTKRLAEQLQGDGKPEVLMLNTLGQTAHRMETTVVSLDVTDVDEQNTVHLSTVYTTTELPISPQCGAVRDELKSWSHLCDIEICDAPIESVDLLIGQDNPEALIPHEVRVSNSQSGKVPFAVRTLLGWTVQGPVKGKNNQRAVVGFTKSDIALQQSLQRFWELDSDEKMTDETRGMSVNDKRVIELWQSKLQISDGHYELPIPFSKSPPQLSDNRIVAERRLELLRKKLIADPEKCSSYKQGIAEMVSKGYAEKVPEAERCTQRADSVVWYLPHHSVTSSQKPDKTRIVFDCAAKYNGVSLNDVVLQGPDLTNRLTAVLMRFRIEPIAMMADIECMFHQVRVTSCDRDVLRFLWWKNDDLNAEPEEYRMTVHPFGGVWSPSCANFALRRTAEDNSNHFDDEVVACIYRNFYVDDCLKSVDSVERAEMFLKQLSELLSCGGFRLRKWISNCREVLKLIPDEDRAKAVKNLDFSQDKLPTERALGAVWDVETDTLGFRSVVSQKPLTRRGILSILSSVYDPLGFLSPYILNAKVIVQELCRQQIGWDDPVPPDILPQWSEWVASLTHVESVKIPRCIKPPYVESVRYELHHFCDASTTAYGTVSYVTVFKADEVVPVSCSLLTAKSRLAPIKVQTVPRLELMAATLAVRMDSLIRQDLDIHVENTTFWTDSTIVLQYIRNERARFHTFVANRLAVIHDVSSPKQWQYVPSGENVADDVSRGLGISQLISNQRWWKGPHFLWRPADEWPDQPLLHSITDSDPEVKNSDHVQEFYVTAKDVLSDSITDQLFMRRSSWTKLKKDVAWIQRFITYLRSKCSQAIPENHSQLSVNELQTAEQAIIRNIQKTHFSQEYSMFEACSSSNDSMKFVRRESVLRRLNPSMNSSGILCVGGRLRHAPSMSSEAKYPVILPKRHHVVDLIIRHVHESSGHVGREHVLSLLQEHYWIIRARVAVRRVLSNCVICRRQAARCGEQFMADLPAERLTADNPPFTYVGVDIFGPFVVRRGRSSVKRYGCLFTCLVVRAIHIEVVHSMDTDSFLNALQRFMCRRGRPAEIFSDNGTNFKAGDRELRKAVQEWNQLKIVSYLHQREIKWRFNPPAASHWGGVWERQIRTVRKILSSLVKEQVLDDESLHTFMCQAEYIVNSRPLTAVSDDPHDLEALTPNHLLTLRNVLMMPLGISAKEDCYCRRRWKQVRYMADVFWRRWSREYLPSLQQRSKWFTVTRDFKPGDIVLLVEDTPRCSWPLARITAVHQGSDGRVRSVTLKTKGTSVVERPISKVCLLEGASTSDGLTSSGQ